MISKRYRTVFLRTIKSILTCKFPNRTEQNIKSSKFYYNKKTAVVKNNESDQSNSKTVI